MEQKVHVLSSYVVRLKEKGGGENAIFGTSDSVCRRQIVGLTVGVLDVKLLIQHDGEGWKS